MTDELSALLANFSTDGEIISCEPCGEGHVNRTYLAVTEANKRYILQRINETAFPNVPALMDNISKVTEFLRKKTKDPRGAMHLIPTVTNENYIYRESGYWRVYDFIEDTVCLQAPRTMDDFYQSAVGFGNFQNMLADFPPESLYEIIPNFHNTPERFRQLHEAINNDVAGRVKTAQREIEFALSKEDEMSQLQNMRESGQLPVRVTHNDTKLNNILLDSTTNKAVCVIDLDTVMPGLCMYDFGDSIRFGAATAVEDELNLDNMTIDLERYKVFAEGYIKACNGLSIEELAMLPLGAKTMSMECSIRFLADYLNGDTYFSIKRASHNLDRARTQLRLYSEMEKKWDEMRRIIDDIVKSPLF